MKPVTLSALWDRIYIGLSLLTILLSLTTVARQLTIVSSVMIETEKLKEDFLFFRESLKKEHGCLYRYKRKMELDKLFDSSFGALDHPMTQLDYGKTIMYVISFLEDSHTGTNIPTLLLNDYAEQEKLFPVLVFLSRIRLMFSVAVKNRISKQKSCQLTTLQWLKYKRSYLNICLLMGKLKLKRTRH